MAKILVIDDESTILQNIKFLLEIDGNEVLTASSSTEGLRIFTENCNSIDVVKKNHASYGRNHPYGAR